MKPLTSRPPSRRPPFSPAPNRTRTRTPGRASASIAAGTA
ncbi:hypothetical protein SAZ_10240 [Streptomyces noursei ZPM]|nr:hypothetical protein SAZ_10240 [Streptomyces noursei ZPM]